MPVKSCQENGKPGWKWGDSGKCYTYTPGDKVSSERAREKAKKQGRAIQVNKASDIQSVRFNKNNFNKNQAISWAKSHDFKYDNVEETTNQWRLRQFPPEKCIKSGGMIHLEEGVSGYVCPTSEKINKLIEEIKGRLPHISGHYTPYVPSETTVD